MFNGSGLKKKVPLIVLLIDAYLFLYAFEVYNINLPFSPSTVRTYIIVILFLLVCIDYTFYHFMSRIQAIICLYMLVVLVGLLVNGLLTLPKAASDLFFPLILLLAIRLFENADSESIHRIVKIQVVCLILFFVLYLYGMNNIGLRYGMFLNSCYYSALLLPFALCLKKTYIRNASILLALIPAAIAAKRGAFVAVILGIIVYFWSQRKTKEFSISKQTNAIWAIITLFGIAIVLFYIGRTYSINVIERLMMASDDGGSGRLDLAKGMIELLGKNGIKDWLIGHGSFTSSKYLGNSSHNDFLEMLWSYGITGFVLYFLMIAYFLKTAISLKKIDSPYYGACLAAIISFIVCSLISQLVFVPTYVAFLLLFFGMCNSRTIQYNEIGGEN